MIYNFIFYIIKHRKAGKKIYNTRLQPRQLQNNQNKKYKQTPMNA